MTIYEADRLQDWLFIRYCLSHKTALFDTMDDVKFPYCAKCNQVVLNDLIYTSDLTTRRNKLQIN